MSACSPRSSVSASTTDSVELDKTLRTDCLSSSMRGRTSGNEDLARVLQSEREYWSRLCLQQVADVEKSMQQKVEALESQIVAKAKESVRHSIDEAASELQGKLSRSQHQEMEVQRVEWETTALQARREQQAETEAAMQAMRRQIEAQCSAKLDIVQATVGELQGKLQEQHQEILMLSERLERLEQQRPERAQPWTSGAACPAAVCPVDTTSKVCIATVATTKGLVPSHPPPSKALAPCDNLQQEPPAPAAAPTVVRPVGTSMTTVTTELPRLLGRGRSPSPTRACYFMTSPKSTAGPLVKVRPAGVDGSSMSDGLKESLKQVVTAVQRTLEDIQDDPEQGAPPPSDLPPAPAAPCAPTAPQQQVIATPAQQTRGVAHAAATVRVAPPPAALHQAHQACQVLVSALKQPGGSLQLRPAGA